MKWPRHGEDGRGINGNWGDWGDWPRYGEKSVGLWVYVPYKRVNNKFTRAGIVIWTAIIVAICI